jgi:hypothetical protein
LTEYLLASTCVITVGDHQVTDSLSILRLQAKIDHKIKLRKFLSIKSINCHVHLVQLSLGRRVFLTKGTSLKFLVNEFVQEFIDKVQLLLISIRLLECFSLLFGFFLILFYLFRLGLRCLGPLFFVLFLASFALV